MLSWVMVKNILFELHAPLCKIILLQSPQNYCTSKYRADSWLKYAKMKYVCRHLQHVYDSDIIASQLIEDSVFIESPYIFILYFFIAGFQYAYESARLVKLSKKKLVPARSDSTFAKINCVV